MRNLFAIFTSVLFFLTVNTGFSHTLSEDILREKMSVLETRAWKVREIQARMHELDDASFKLDKALVNFKKTGGSLADDIIDSDGMDLYSRLYQKLDNLGKQAHSEVVRKLIANAHQAGDKALSQDTLKEYFPGWGEGKKGFIYEVREEVKREFLHAFWKTQVINEKISSHQKIKVELSLVAKLKAQFPELIEGLKFSAEIDGKIVYFKEVSFSKEVQIKTTQKTKWAHERVWFNLYESKKPWPWQSPKWKKVGKTFKNITGSTGQKVIIDAHSFKTLVSNS